MIIMVGDDDEELIDDDIIIIDNNNNIIVLCSWIGLLESNKSSKTVSYFECLMLAAASTLLISYAYISKPVEIVLVLSIILPLTSVALKTFQPSAKAGCIWLANHTLLNLLNIMWLVWL